MIGPPARARLVRAESLDWLRGVALVLMLLSHGWALWSMTGLERFPPIIHILQSGNVAVTVFLVVAGFLLTRSLIGQDAIRSDEVGAPGNISAEQPVRAIASRVVRLSSQVYPLLGFVLLVAWFDAKEFLTFRQTVTSVLAVGTYTWNWYLQGSAAVARPDLGHLWYAAVYVQVTVLLVCLVRSLRHRRVVLIALLAGLLLACTLWRSHVVVSEGEFRSLLRTTSRMDGMLWGALLALVWPWTRQLRVHGGTLVGWGLIGFALLVLSVGNSPAYMGWAGVATNMCIVLFVLGSYSMVPGPLSRLVTFRPLVWFGRHSLSLYVWHYPIYFFVARHLGNWPGAGKAAVATALVVLASVLTTRWIERPVARWTNALLLRQREGTQDLPEISGLDREAKHSAVSRGDASSG